MDPRVKFHGAEITLSFIAENMELTFTLKEGMIEKSLTNLFKDLSLNGSWVLKFHIFMSIWSLSTL